VPDRAEGHPIGTIQQAARFRVETIKCRGVESENIMIELALVPMFAAVGYSLLYLLLGGGLGGAVLIFIVAKALGK
jgi:hypothetical protein